MSYKYSKIKNMGIFTIKGEDHTLGNLLQYQLMADSSVRFAGYKKSHPLEDILILKIQVSELTEIDALNNSVNILIKNIDSYLEKMKF